MYTREEAEGKRLKNPFDTVTEGIGINRITKNFMMAELDGAYRGTDQEAVEMSRSVLIFQLRVNLFLTPSLVLWMEHAVSSTLMLCSSFISFGLLFFNYFWEDGLSAYHVIKT